MAISRSKPKKITTVTTFPQSESAVAVEEPATPAESASETKPITPFDPPKVPNKGGRPKKGEESPEPNFFRRVAAVPAADWGTRVYLYLYQIEPVCDLKQSGGKAYLMRYQEAVRDEHQIMLEQGSGKYRLVLAANKISPAASNEVARYDFEVYNPQYPPRIPKEVWVNDPRNRRWEALLPKQEIPQPPGAASTIIDAMKVYGDIRRDVREEIGEPEEPTSRTSEVLETMKAAKELFGSNGNGTSHNGAQPDPFDTAKKIMDMRGNDPMIAALMQRLDAADKAAEKARDREFELMKELRQQSTAPASKGLADQLLELAALGDKLEPIKKLFGFGNGEVVGRAARTTAYDVVRDIASSPFGSNLGQGLGILLTNLASAGAQQPNPAQQPRPPIVLNQQQNNGTAQPTESLEQRIQRIGQIITQPMIYEFFLKEQPGEIFAQQMFDMWPEDYLFMRGLGAEDIVRRYQSFGPAWAVLAPKEPAFIEFIQEFCKWDPNQDEESQEPEASAVTDLEAE